jgi:hypothetical protein
MAPMMGGQMPKEDNGVEDYSHKDLDPEALIDFLVETLKMPYRDAKALTMSHKTKELVEANHRKGKLAARASWLPVINQERLPCREATRSAWGYTPRLPHRREPADSRVERIRPPSTCLASLPCREFCSCVLA